MIGDRFVERFLVAVGSEIKFQRLALHAGLRWNVIDLDPGKVRLSRDRTERSEIVRLEMDHIVAPGRIRECLEPGFCRGGGNARLAAAEESQAIRFAGPVHLSSIACPRSLLNSCGPR